MKKKFATLIMASVMGLSCIAGFAGCGGDTNNGGNGDTGGNEQTKEHTLVAHAAKDATCTEAGNKAYWECTDCGKLFSDKDGESETTLSAVTIAAKGHILGKWLSDNEGHWKQCSECSYTTEKTEHIFDTQLLCETCGYQREETPPKQVFTVILQCNNVNFTEEQCANITLLQAQCTDKETNQVFTAHFNEEGIASLFMVDSNYKVTLITPPDGFTYNSNIYSLDNTHNSVVINLYKLTPTNGTGADPYINCITIATTGAYRVTLQNAAQEIWLRIKPTESGLYSMESLVDVTSNKINPILYTYAGTNNYINYESEQIIDGGGAENTFTKNFRWEIQLPQEEVNSMRFFKINSTNTDPSAYPLTVDFIYDKDGYFTNKNLST